MGVPEPWWLREKENVVPQLLASAAASGSLRNCSPLPSWDVTPWKCSKEQQQQQKRLHLSNPKMMWKGIIVL